MSSLLKIISNEPVNSEEARICTRLLETLRQDRELLEHVGNAIKAILERDFLDEEDEQPLNIAGRDDPPVPIAVQPPLYDEGAEFDADGLDTSTTSKDSGISAESSSPTKPGFTNTQASTGEGVEFSPLWRSSVTLGSPSERSFDDDMCCEEDSSVTLGSSSERSSDEVMDCDQDSAPTVIFGEATTPVTISDDEDDIQIIYESGQASEEIIADPGVLNMMEDNLLSQLAEDVASFFDCLENFMPLALTGKRGPTCAPKGCFCEKHQRLYYRPYDEEEGN